MMEISNKGHSSDARQDDSDTDSELIIVEENKSSRKNRLQKRSKKKKVMDYENEQLIKESGLDVNDMTKEEIKTVVSMLRQSKQEALEKENKATSSGFRDVQNSNFKQDHDENQHRSNFSITTDRDDGTEYVNKSRHETSKEDVHDVDGDEHEECQNLKDKESRVQKNGNKYDGEKIKRGKRQGEKKKSEDISKNLKQRKLDHFSHIIIPDDNVHEEVPDISKTNNLIVEDDKCQERSTEMPQAAEVGQKNKDYIKQEKNKDDTLCMENVPETIDDEDDDLTQPPDSPDMFGFQQLLEPADPRKNGKSAEKVEEKQSDKATLKTDTDATQPFDADTQVDEDTSETQMSSHLKKDDDITKQIEKGKSFFERVKNSASKLTTRWSRKRKQDDKESEISTESKMSGEIEDAEMTQEEDGGENVPPKQVCKIAADDCMEVETSEPLTRRYRTNIKTTASNSKNIPNFSKAILQLFEIYERKLKIAQSKMSNVVKWGDPVKPGPHLDNTIDYKRRGQVYDFLDLDDEKDNNSSHAVVNSSKRNSLQPQVKKNKQMKIPVVFSDDDDVDENFKHQKKKTIRKVQENGRNTRQGRTTLYNEEKDFLPDLDTKDDPDFEITEEIDWKELMEEDTQDFRPNKDYSHQRKRGRPKKDSVPSKKPLTRSASDLSASSLPSETGRSSPDLLIDEENINRSSSQEDRSTNSKNVHVVRPSHSTRKVQNIDRPSSPGPESLNSTSRLQKMVRPPSRGSESSMDGLSQGSSVMFDEQGELYSTQMCVLRDKMPDLKKVKPGGDRINVHFGRDTSIKDEIDSDHAIKRKFNFAKRGNSAKKGAQLSESCQENEDDNELEHVFNMSGNRSCGEKIYASKTPMEKEKDLRKMAMNIDKQDEVALIEDYESDDEITFKSKTKDKENYVMKNEDSSVFHKMKKTRYISDNEFEKVSSENDLSTPIKPFNFYNRKINTVHSEQELEENFENIQNIGTSTSSNYKRKVSHRESVNEESIGDSNAETKRGTKRNFEEISCDKQKKKEKVEMIACPICLQEFSMAEIAEHASECDGTVPEDKPRYHGEQQISDDDGRDKKLTPELSRPRGEKRFKDTPQQEQVKTEILGNKMGDKVEEGEVENCYVCDQYFLKGEVYSKHIDQCLKEAMLRQEEADMRGYTNRPTSNVINSSVEKRTTRSRIKEEKNGLLGKLDQVWEEVNDGYSSGSESEHKTLQDTLSEQVTESSDSESDYSGSDEYDYSPVKVSPKIKSTKNNLPGGWTLDELTNSPIKTFVPIWCQNDSEGFKNQFEMSKQKFEKQAIRKQMSGKRNTKKRKTKKPRRRKKRKANFADQRHAKKLKIG